MDYDIDKIIDENALDLEWLQQAELGIKYGEYWAKCQAEVDRAEEKVKVVRSEIVAEAWDDPEGTMGVAKATAQNVEAYYRTHKDHQEAKEELIQAKLDLNMAEVAKKEISITRKDALKGLVELLKVNYFESPLDPRDLSHEAEKKRLEKDHNARIGSKMKKRKKVKK
jgi:hypothetical protein